MSEFKGQKYIENSNTWTPEYDQWRRDNNLCNSLMTWTLAKKEERRKKPEEELFRRTPFLVKVLVAGLGFLGPHPTGYGYGSRRG